MSYTLFQQLNSQYAHIEFKGPFQGKTVTWNTHLMTLDEYTKQQNIELNGLKQFIEIEKMEPYIFKLCIALKVSIIDTPIIEKMMIMIKQYKNLSPGHHEYG